MTESCSKVREAKTSLGRPLLILTILAVLLACALVVMSIYLFEADSGVDLEAVSLLNHINQL